MTTTNTKSRTAIVLMAVLVISLALGGCVTKRDMDEVKNRLTLVEQQSRETHRLVARMDSLIVASAEADNAMRSDIRNSNGQLQQQVAALLENYNQLVQQINAMRGDLQARGVLRGSVGTGTVTQTPPVTTSTTPTTPPPTPVLTGVNCDSTYDDAFILARQEEYTTAIDGFRNFLADCATHENVASAYFWIGECFFRQKQYDRAMPEFSHVAKTYQDSPKAVSALYKVARCQQELGKLADAKKTFQQVVADYPASSEANEAKKILPDL